MDRDSLYDDFTRLRGSFFAACSSHLLRANRDVAAYEFAELEQAGAALSKDIAMLRAVLANVDSCPVDCWNGIASTRGAIDHLRAHSRRAISWLDDTAKALEDIPEVRRALELDEEEEDG